MSDLSKPQVTRSREGLPERESSASRLDDQPDLRAGCDIDLGDIATGPVDPRLNAVSPCGHGDAELASWSQPTLPLAVHLDDVAAQEIAVSGRRPLKDELTVLDRHVDMLARGEQGGSALKEPHSHPADERGHGDHPHPGRLSLRSMPTQQVLTGTTSTGIDAELVLAEVNTLTAAAEVLHELSPTGSSYALLLACDARYLPVEDISALSKTALRTGMHYFSAWGPDCERVHDIVDADIVDLDLHLDDRDRAGAPESAPEFNPDRGLVMTTWHDEEPLSETLEFFWTCASPAGGQEDSGLRLLITMAMPLAGDEVRAATDCLRRAQGAGRRRWRRCVASDAGGP